jgi:hypothetical protein
MTLPAFLIATTPGISILPANERTRARIPPSGQPLDEVKETHASAHMFGRRQRCASLQEVWP